jgi:adenosyl cobinamide kinase/adenosyl cobinamide phosphate guanylyltransferase
MILIIGGAASGKRDYAKSLGYGDDEISRNAWELLRENPSKGDALFNWLRDMPVVICDEVGSGIVPLERSERELRDNCGRLCIALAQEAERVVRMVAGIPVTIK